MNAGVAALPLIGTHPPSRRGREGEGKKFLLQGKSWRRRQNRLTDKILLGGWGEREGGERWRLEWKLQRCPPRIAMHNNKEGTTRRMEETRRKQKGRKGSLWVGCFHGWSGEEGDLDGMRKLRSKGFSLPIGNFQCAPHPDNPLALLCTST